MTQPNEKPRSNDERKPYRPPQIVDSADFETLALSCAKFQYGSGGNPYCPGGPFSAS